MIECSCGRAANSIKYKIRAQKGYSSAILNVIENNGEGICACGKFVVELIRIKKDKATNICTADVITKQGKDAFKLYDKLEPLIISEIKLPNNASNRWYLEYGEFGVKKKCYSNISSVKIGLTDNTIGFERKNIRLRA